MRTTIDLPDDLFREAKTRAVREGTTLKSLMTDYIRAGLRGQTRDVGSLGKGGKPPPPVAIRRVSGKPMKEALTNRELNALMDDEDAAAVEAAQSASEEEA